MSHSSPRPPHNLRTLLTTRLYTLEDIYRQKHWKIYEIRQNPHPAGQKLYARKLWRIQWKHDVLASFWFFLYAYISKLEAGDRDSWHSIHFETSCKQEISTKRIFECPQDRFLDRHRSNLKWEKSIEFLLKINRDWKSWKFNENASCGHSKKHLVIFFCLQNVSKCIICQGSRTPASDFEI